MKKWICYIGRSALLQSLLILISASTTIAQKAKDSFIVHSAIPIADTRYVQEIPNTSHPQIAYWFITADLLVNDKYLRDLENFAANTPFDLIFLTARSVDFFDHEKMHPVFTKMVKRAHELGLKIGLQLWQEDLHATTIEDYDALVSEKELTLDAFGKTACTMETFSVRAPANIPVKSELIRAYAFKKTANGLYKQGSLANITTRCSTDATPGKITITVDLGKAYAGYQVYLLSAHYRKAGNLSGEYYVRSYKAILDKYADIPFDGTGLDEFKNMPVKRPYDLKDGTFPERRYSLPLSSHYQKKYNRTLEEDLFTMRFVPPGKEADRVTAINRYMEEIRTSTAKIERVFYDKSKAVFGKHIFSGLHNTYHGSTDELWHTGRNYWNLPREYGQTDEMESKPVQLGVLYSYPKNILYNMFYYKNADTFLLKAAADLAFNIRTHYHALNDAGTSWGVTVDKPEFLKRLNPLEKKARLLNHFDPAPPRADLLVLFGFGAMMNWYPDEAAKDEYGMHDRKTGIFQKAAAVWDSGYVNALLPDDQVANGKLKLDNKNRLVYNGHIFTSMIFLYPQFAKESTIQLLETFVAKGGKLMLEGPATLDFHGNDVSDRFRKIYAGATVPNFDISRLPELGVTKNPIPKGITMKDGTVVMSDFASLESKPINFSVSIEGDLYEGSYSGVLAIKSSKKTGLQKLACGNFTQLKKNGKLVLAFKKPADLFLTRNADGKYKLLIAGDKHNIF